MIATTIPVERTDGFVLLAPDLLTGREIKLGDDLVILLSRERVYGPSIRDGRRVAITDLLFPDEIDSE